MAGYFTIKSKLAEKRPTTQDENEEGEPTTAQALAAADAQELAELNPDALYELIISEDTEEGDKRRAFSATLYVPEAHDERVPDITPAGEYGCGDCWMVTFTVPKKVANVSGKMYHADATLVRASGVPQEFIRYKFLDGCEASMPKFSALPHVKKAGEAMNLAETNSLAVIRVDIDRKSSRDRDGNRTSYTEILATLYTPQSVDQVAQDKLDDADGDYVLLDRIEHILDDEDEEDIEATSSAVTEAEERLVKSILTDGVLDGYLAQAQSVRVYFPYYDETYVRGENGFELSGE